MTTKEYLKQYRIYNEKLRQLDKEIKALESEIDTVRASDDTGHGSSIANRTEVIAIRLADIKARRHEAYIRAWTKREEVENVILMSPDPIYGRLLYDRYILFMSWADITEDLHYEDDTHVRGRLHSRALMSVASYIPVEEA